MSNAEAACAKDESVRLQSSSGGIFTVLAERVLDGGGVVVGVAQTAPTRFGSGKSVSVHHGRSKYMRLFLSRICQNTSCDGCHYRKLPRIADIILGDYWGISKYHPEMMWLTQDGISRLFDVDRSVVTKHLKNVFETNELEEISVCAKFAHTAADGKTYNTKFYNLDAIISVGYRVNSIRATQFRPMYLDYAEFQAKRQIPMTMEDWALRLNKFLDFNEVEILTDKGRVSAEIATAFAESEFEKYRVVQDKLFKSDFDKFLNEAKAIEEKK